MSSYQPNIPTGTVDLDQDYLNLQGNFQQINTTYLQDHIPLTDVANNGYHKAIHMVQQAAPVAVASVGELYCTTVNDGINNDEVLFYQTGGGRIMQLTRNFVPETTNNTNRNGYTFLPGGVIFQWGFLAGSAANTIAVLFATNNINFPNACFNVNVIPIRAASSPGSDFSTVIVTGSVSSTGFTIGNVGSHTMQGWYWQAIGN